MKHVILYFQLHQPYRVNLLPTPDSSWKELFVGPNPGKFGKDMSNETIFNQVATQCYIPTTEFWLRVFQQIPELHLCLSFSGTFLEQCLEYPLYGSKVLALLQELVATGRVEILDETYYHSLSFMVNWKEYIAQIKLHRQLIKTLFDYEPKTFRNTELIYNDTIGEVIRKLGYESIVAEEPFWNLRPEQYASNSFLWNDASSLEQEDLRSILPIAGLPSRHLNIFLRHEDASNAIIFLRDQTDRLVEQALQATTSTVIIGTDYEFMGEHTALSPEIEQHLVKQLQTLLDSHCSFDTFSSISSLYKHQETGLYSSPEYSSWGHKEKDISVWRGGNLQEQAFQVFHQAFDQITALDNPELLEAWRRFSTSCHFYFLGKKEGLDQNFVNLFSPYESPEQALTAYLGALHDLLGLAKLKKFHQSTH